MGESRIIMGALALTSILTMAVTGEPEPSSTDNVTS